MRERLEVVAIKLRTPAPAFALYSIPAGPLAEVGACPAFVLSFLSFLPYFLLCFLLWPSSLDEEDEDEDDDDERLRRLL